MKTSTNVSEIENYLFGKLDTPSKLVFEAKLLINPVLKLNVESQRRLYSIIRLTGRRKLKSELEQIHSRLFSDPKRNIFQQGIHQLFNKK
jgi:hypothetical protein